MWIPRARRSARTQKVDTRRYVPQLERCEDRLPPGQIFALFADPLAAPFGALPGVTEPEQDELPALVSEPESQPTGRTTPTQSAVGRNLSGMATEPAQVIRAPGANVAGAVAVTQSAAPAEFITQLVASLSGQELGQDPVAVGLQGTIEAFGLHGLNGNDGMTYFLNTGEQRLQLLGMPEHVDNGAVVAVSGTLQGENLTVADDGITVLEPSPYLPPTEGGPGTTAVRTVLVINMNFLNNQSQPWNPANQYNLWNGSFNNWFDEGSYGQLQIAVDTSEWLTIPSNNSPCNSSTWASQAQSLVRSQQGLEPNNYNHVVLAFPSTGSCGWSGLGQAPGRITWLNGVGQNRGVATHELGHNLGLLHSHSRTCNAGPLDGSCTVSEYGDLADTMGGASTNAHFHASYRQYVGWIPSSDRVVVRPADGLAIVPIRSLASPEGDRVIQVQRTGRSDSLYVEWREPVGFDATLNSYPSLLSGVNVYLGTNTNLRDQSIVDYGYTTSSARDAGLPMENVLIDFAGDLLILPIFEFEGERWVLIYYGLG